MNNIVTLISAAIAGLGLGLFFYGGLYLTVTRGLKSQRPALWFFTSFVLRMAAVLSGFYFINDGDWPRIISCLAGFIFAGFVFTMWKKVPSSTDKISAKGGARHAP